MNLLLVNLSCDITDKIIGILFVCLITACAGILIFGILIAPSYLTNANATQWHDGSMYVTQSPPHKNFNTTFWIQKTNTTQNVQEIKPLVFADTAFFFYPHNLFNTTGSVLHDRVFYDPRTDEIVTYPGVYIHGNFVWARPMLALYENAQIMNQTIIDLENKIETLEQKLGKQGKRIQQLETALLLSN